MVKIKVEEVLSEASSDWSEPQHFGEGMTSALQHGRGHSGFAGCQDHTVLSAAAVPWA